MAFQNRNYGWFPHPIVNIAQANYVIDASGEKVGFRFPVTRAGNIRKMHVRIGTITSSQSLTATFSNESGTDGFGDGVADQTSAAIAVPTASAWNSFDFTGVERTVAVDDVVVGVIAFTSTAGNLQVIVDGAQNSMMSRAAHFTASWAHTGPRGMLAFLEFDDGTIMPVPDAAWGVASNVTFNSGSGNQERGLKFRNLSPVKVGGIGWGTLTAWAGNGTWTLYDSDGTTVLGSFTTDKDSMIANPNSSYFHSGHFAAVELLANTYYYAVLQPLSGSNVALRAYDVSTAAWLDGSSGGQDYHWVERLVAGSGAFTATLTRRGTIHLYETAYDDAVQVGGGTTIAGTPMMRGMVG
jgi:hypothetical protein